MPKSKKWGNLTFAEFVHADSDIRVMTCALEYEYARSNPEVVNGLRRKNCLSEFALRLHELTPGFPHLSWSELDAASKERFITPEPPDLFNDEDVLQDPAEIAFRLSGQFTHLSVDELTEYRQLLPLYVNLNCPIKKIIDSLRSDLTRLQKQIESNRRGIFGGPEERKERGQPFDQIALPLCKRKAISTRGTLTQKLKQEFVAFAFARKQAFVASSTRSDSEARNFSRYSARVVANYRKFGNYWISFSRPHSHCSAFPEQYEINGVSAVSKWSKVESGSPLATLVKQEDQSIKRSEILRRILAKTPPEETPPVESIKSKFRKNRH